MRRRSWSIAGALTVLAAIVVADGASAHPTEFASPLTGPPSAAFSTSGDYASDVLGDPWDFSNDEDVPPVNVIGTEGSFSIARDANGILTLGARNGSLVKLVRTWGAVLPWGRDGLNKPIDAAIYTRVSFSLNIDQGRRDMLVRYVNEAGQSNRVRVTNAPTAGFHTYEIDLTQPGLDGPSVWTGKIIRFDILAGGPSDGNPDPFTMQLDWVSLHRADVHPTSVPAGPVVRMLSPSDEGGADYATDSGDQWDFTGPDDVASTGDLVIDSFAGGNMAGRTIANDSFVELPLRTPLIPDKYHRLTVDVCYDGGFSLADAAGGGMNARLAWFDEGGQIWSETQDIVIYPGCNRMTIDLATNPAAAVNDEGTIYKAGWRGLRISALRFDLNEDRGVRSFSLNDIRLADDAAFSSGTFPVSFLSNSGGSADIFVTTDEGAWNGTKVGSVAVTPGVNTFNWNGSGMPNGTYWVYAVVHNGATIGSSYSSGPVRIERPLPPTRSFFVPLNPARLLDTRDGTGGNLSGLSRNTFTQLKVDGVGGVPATGATAVVLNVTVASPITNGFITAWPSGEDQPTVSNLNFVPGQTVPNLVTVKIGANGKINLYNSEGFTQVVADVVGYYTSSPPAAGGRFTAVTPGRLLDTRLGAGIPVGPSQTINVPVTGQFGVPSTGVTGVAVNVTVDQPTSSGFLTVWPTGEPQPLASSHNFVPGLTIANLVLAKVGAGGQISIFNNAGQTHVVVDIVGYFSSAGGLFIPVSPNRLVDSRFGIGRGVTGPLGQQQAIDVDVAGVGPVPTGASAAIVNVTSVGSTTPSYITVWPTGGQRPTASTMNPRPGVPVPNLAYLKLGTGGQLSVYNNTG
ncbi:MAG TPA: hypothetical protein VIH06_10230, partial [Ilumatobacteraceae bacterium]